jgi:hypothetical protein
MAPFLYRCPKTGFNIQGWVADDPASAKSVVPVDCPLCNSVHLVNLAAGENPGEDDPGE